MLILAGCKRKEEIPKGEYGGTLYIGIVGEPERLNPLLPSLFRENYITKLIFSPLFKINPNGKITPVIAESWEYSEDLKSITFYLNKNAKWWDGHPVTSKDLYFTFKTLYSEGITHPLKRKLHLIDTFEIIDNYTFRITFKEPYGWEIMDCNITPVPYHILKNQDILTSKFNFEPVGNGPFKLKKWIRGDRLILEKNELYWGKKPFLNRVVFVFFKNPKELFMALKEGRIDFAVDLSSDYAIKLLENKDLVIKAVPSSKVTILGFNLKNKVLADKKIREAINNSINREKIVKTILKGYGKALNIPIPPQSWAYPKKIRILYEPEKYYSVLSKIKDTLTLIVSEGDKIKEAIAYEIQKELKEFNVNIKVKKLSPYEFVLHLFNKNFDMYLLSWDVGERIDLVPLLHSRGGLNFMGYSDKIMDKLLIQAEKVLNPQRGKEIYKKICKKFLEDLPCIVLFSENKIITYSKKLKNINPYLQKPFEYMELVWIPKKLQAIAKVSESKGRKKIKGKIKGQITKKSTLKQEVKKTKIETEEKILPPPVKVEELLKERVIESPEILKEIERKEEKPKAEKTIEIKESEKTEIKKEKTETEELEYVVIRPIALKKVPPVYPEMAKKLGVKGFVYLRVLVGKDGEVKKVRVYRSLNPLCDNAAIEAVKKWKYKPALTNKNRPVDFWTIEIVEFK